MSERFLIVKPSSLGDIVHAFPAVSMLSKAYPGAVFDWIAAPAFAGLVKCHPAVDRVILFKRKELGTVKGFLNEFPALYREVRKYRYTAVLDFQGLLRSAMIGRLASAEVYAGPDSPREKTALAFYTRRLKTGDFHTHAVLKNCRMAADFLGTGVPEKIEFEFSPGGTSAAHVAEKLTGFANVQHWIAVAPGARWETKEWPASFFADAANQLVKHYPGCGFLLLGAPDEKESCLELKEKIHAPVVDLCGKTSLPELTEAIRLSDLMICNDSGPMHIAAAVQTPVIPVFGPTDPVLTGPFQPLDLVLRPGLECELCFKRTCDTMACHEKIDPARVISLVRDHQLLAHSAKSQLER